MSDYALIQGDRVANVVSVDSTTLAGQAYLVAIVSHYDRIIPAEGYARGQYLDASGNPIPLPALTTDVPSIPPDGTTAATITYTNGQPDAPASVVFDVNGSTTEVALSGGSASIAVTSTTSGDEVTVQADGLSITIGVS